MTLRLLDEANYDAEMESKVLPALDACMTEGWMDPATVDWNGDALPKLDEPGRLHYCCYDAAKFDALREDGASGVFRGAIVISHGFTEFARKYSEMAWYFLLSGYSVCILEHRGHGHSAHDVSNPSLVWIDDWRRYVAEFEKKHRRRRRAAHYVVLPVARHGVRAFVISEFGGLAQLVPEHAAVSRAYGYGEYDSIDDWRAAVRSVLASAAALESRGLAGYVYTQVSDVEEELNGLLTYDRRVDKFAE